MKKYLKKQLLIGGALLERIGCPQNKITKLARYAEMRVKSHIDYSIVAESARNIPDDVILDMIKFNLRILVKLNESDNLVIINQPTYLDAKFEHTLAKDIIVKPKYIQVCTYEESIAIKPELIQSLAHETNISNTFIDESIIESYVNKFNKLITKGKLYLYEPISSVAVVSEGTYTPKLLLRSRYFFDSDENQEKLDVSL